VDWNGTIFLANDRDGLRTYTYNGSSFTTTAHINNGGEANGVAILGGGTIFLANGSDGLRAYTYNGSSFTNTVMIMKG
jgi:YD repeat-containing protein